MLWQGTEQLGAQERETYLPFAESLNVFHGAVLPGSQADAGTDLFSHHRILHANHLGGTEGRENPGDTPVHPWARCACRVCVLAHEPSAPQDARAGAGWLYVGRFGLLKIPLELSACLQSLPEGLPCCLLEEMCHSRHPDASTFLCFCRAIGIRAESDP